MPSDYGKGKIYKLVNNISNKSYIGSTICSLSLRKCRHSADYKAYKNKNKNYITSFEIFKEAEKNNDNVQIILLENYPCNSIEELKSKVRFYIDKDCNCVNKNIPIHQTQEKLIINQKICQKLNKNQNKEKVICKCGRSVQRLRLAKHQLTKLHKKHLERMNKINKIINSSDIPNSKL